MYMENVRFQSLLQSFVIALHEMMLLCDIMISKPVNVMFRGLNPLKPT